jgi:hypothetical protein
VTQSSSDALAREVQKCYCGKFRRTNDGSTGGRNFGKFKCTNEEVQVFEPFIGFTRIIYRWKAYHISKLFCFESFLKLCTFLKLFQKLIIRFSRLFLFSECIFVAVFIPFIGMMHMIQFKGASEESSCAPNVANYLEHAIILFKSYLIFITTGSFTARVI